MKELPHHDSSQEKRPEGRIGKILRELGTIAGFSGMIFSGVGLPLYEKARETEYEEKFAPAIEKRLRTIEEKEKKLQESFGEHCPQFSNVLRAQIREERSRFTTPFVSSKKPGTAFDRPATQSLIDWPEDRVPADPQITELPGGLDTETLKRVITEVFPDGWVRNEIKSIKYKDEHKKPGLEYGLGEEWETVAECGHFVFSGEKSEITFYKTKNDRTGESNLAVIAHEIAHANDWGADNEMTAEERVNLLLAIAKRLESSDRFQSLYVESIQNKDEQKKKYLQATEYWAEVCRQAFTDPSKLHIEDFNLVKKCVERGDKKFDWGVSKATRDLVARILQEKNKK